MKKFAITLLFIVIVFSCGVQDAKAGYDTNASRGGGYQRPYVGVTRDVNGALRPYVGAFRNGGASRDRGAFRNYSRTIRGGSSFERPNTNTSREYNYDGSRRGEGLIRGY